MLDLTVFNQETFDIKFSELETIHIKKADEELAIKLMGYMSDEDVKKKDIKELVKIVNTLTRDILNHNTDSKKFTIADITNLKFDVKMAILQQYTEFIYGLQNNPN